MGKGSDYHLDQAESHLVKGKQNVHTLGMFERCVVYALLAVGHAAVAFVELAKEESKLEQEWEEVQEHGGGFERL